MNKQQRKIRELRARFVTKLTKQTKVLRAMDYARSGCVCPERQKSYNKNKKWVDACNDWYQTVGINPKNAADQIRQMSISDKNKFYLWLSYDYNLFRPYGNHFEEKFAMVIFVLSKPRTQQNLRVNYKIFRNSYAIMQDSVNRTDLIKLVTETYYLSFH
jgi:hypothetical protein